MYFIILTIFIALVCANDVHENHSKDTDFENLKRQVERLSVLRQEDHKEIQRLESLYISERKERLALGKSLAELQLSQNASTLARDTRSGPLVFAFHAILSRDFNSTQDKQILLFDTVTADFPTFHSHYNVSEGKYKCRLEGIYHFTWTIGPTGPGSVAQTSLVKNGDFMGMMVAYDSYSSSAATVIMHLDINDSVWVEVATRGSSVLRDVSTFSAFRLAD
ncbi:complement C1q-like protein 2 [Ylistrum balloti]|uniref:complement C1q-like protein 2 n=1 Tax=Ylistrum balloti TaxID=509963 RepID=UPI002905D5F0|nr:complement C1q-like protein 2 [Ylistrum balloti]